MENSPLDCSIYCTRCYNIGTKFINDSQFHKMCDYCSSFNYEGILECIHCYSILLSLPDSYCSCLATEEIIVNQENINSIEIKPNEINEPAEINNVLHSENIIEPVITNNIEIIEEKLKDLIEPTSLETQTCPNYIFEPEDNKILQNEKECSSGINEKDTNNIDENNGFYNKICPNLKDIVHHPDCEKKSLRFKCGIDSDCEKCFRNLYCLSSVCIKKNFEKRQKVIVMCFLCKLDSISYLVLNCRHFVCSKCFSSDMDISDTECFHFKEEIDESFCKLCYFKIDSNSDHNCRKIIIDEEYNNWNFKRFPSKAVNSYY